MAPRSRTGRARPKERDICSVAELQNITLIKAACAQPNASTADDVEIEFDVSWSCTTDENDPFRHLTTVRYSAREAQDKSDSMTMAAEFGLTFTTPNFKATDKDREKLASTSGVLISWPYWRELIDSLSSRMKLPYKILLPALRFDSEKIDFAADVHRPSSRPRKQA